VINSIIQDKMSTGQTHNQVVNNTDTSVVIQQKRTELDLTVSGYSFSQCGFGLKLGTLFASTGNANAVKKNILKQLVTRLGTFGPNGLTRVSSVKFCVPDSTPDTEEVVRTCVRETFVGHNEFFVEMRDKFPDLLFVKVLFIVAPRELETINLGTFILSTGNAKSIQKNIRTQFDKIMDRYVGKFNLDLIGTLRFIVPVYSDELTKLCIVGFLTERFPDRTYQILKFINGSFLVEVHIK
jgi:hypothetical protein